jgi:hypothetical protein
MPIRPLGIGTPPVKIEPRLRNGLHGAADGHLVPLIKWPGKANKQSVRDLVWRKVSLCGERIALAETKGVQQEVF